MRSNDEADDNQRRTKAVLEQMANVAEVGGHDEVMTTLLAHMRAFAITIGAFHGASGKREELAAFIVQLFALFAKEADSAYVKGAAFARDEQSQKGSASNG